jgi:hypothetical protein
MRTAMLSFLLILLGTNPCTSDSPTTAEEKLRALGVSVGTRRDAQGPTTTYVWFGPQSRATDADLRLLKSIASLRVLTITSARITNAGLRHLRGLDKLQTLNLQSRRDGLVVDDNGLKSVASLHGLRTLNLRGTSLTDCGMKALKSLGALESLTLSYTRVSDEGLKQLLKLTSLKTLDLQATKVRGHGLRHLQGLNRLTWIDLSGTRLEIDNVKLLTQMKSLEVIQLALTPITDDALIHFRQMKHLRLLNLLGTPTTHERVKELQMALPRRVKIFSRPVWSVKTEIIGHWLARISAEVAYGQKTQPNYNSSSRERLHSHTFLPFNHLISHQNDRMRFRVAESVADDSGMLSSSSGDASSPSGIINFNRTRLGGVAAAVKWEISDGVDFREDDTLSLAQQPSFQNKTRKAKP